MDAVALADGDEPLDHVPQVLLLAEHVVIEHCGGRAGGQGEGESVTMGRRAWKRRQLGTQGHSVEAGEGGVVRVR